MVAQGARIIQEAFLKAIELEGKDRERFFEGLSAELAREVRSLVSSHEAARGFLENSPVARPLLEVCEPKKSSAVLGTRIGVYRIQAELGEGGMSRVFLGVRDDDEFRREVAIKVIRRELDRPDLLERFLRERQILATLDHPNLTHLLDGGTTEDGLPYLVLDYVEGEPLDVFCDKHELGVSERLELFLPVCSAVSYAHSRLVVHRDLKPSNVLVSADGTPKLLDFGIAKLLNPDEFPLDVERTEIGLEPMTPYYASPEQLAGRTITTGTDVYALGVLLFKLLTGRFPYRIDEWTRGAVRHAVLHDPPDRLSEAILHDRDGPPGQRPDPISISQARATDPASLRRRLTGDLEAIVAMSLKKDPSERYQSVEELSADLERHLGGLPVRAVGDTRSYRTRKFLYRNRWRAAVVILTVSLLAGLAVAMASQARRIAKERDRARNVVAFLEQILQVSDPLERAGGMEVTAREILDSGAERVKAELADQPEVQATLLNTIGTVYRNLGLYDNAERVLREALRARERLFGPRHSDVGESLHALAVALRQKGDYEESTILFEQALSLREEVHGAKSQEVAKTLNAQGMLFQEIGDLTRARDVLLSALSIQRALDGSRSAEIADQLSNLAIVENELGARRAAEPLFHQALEIRREIFGNLHPIVAESLNDLGVFLGIQGDYDLAEPLLVEALEIRRGRFDGPHPEVTQSLHNLGRLFEATNRLQEAEIVLREAVALETSLRGEDHPALARHLHALALVLARRGELSEAETYFENALSVRSRSLGSGHRLVAHTRLELGKTLIGLGETERATQVLRQAMDGLSQNYSLDHWRLAECESSLGLALASTGSRESAHEYLVRGHRNLSDSLGPRHRLTLEAADRIRRASSLF